MLLDWLRYHPEYIYQKTVFGTKSRILRMKRISTDVRKCQESPCISSMNRGLTTVRIFSAGLTASFRWENGIRNCWKFFIPTINAAIQKHCCWFRQSMRVSEAGTTKARVVLAFLATYFLSVCNRVGKRHLPLLAASLACIIHMGARIKKEALHMLPFLWLNYIMPFQQLLNVSILYIHAFS